MSSRSKKTDDPCASQRIEGPNRHGCAFQTARIYPYTPEINQKSDCVRPLDDVLARVPPCPGTYALVYRCDASFQAAAGKLGSVSFSTGYWIYIGSAFGSGGLRSRLGHHLRPSPRPHWHLDYVKNALCPVEIWTTTDAVKREHDWAATLASLKGATCPVSGFGASDCACRSHLIHLRRRPGFTGFRKRIRKAILTHGPLFRVLCP